MRKITFYSSSFYSFRHPRIADSLGPSEDPPYPPISGEMSRHKQPITDEERWEENRVTFPSGCACRAVWKQTCNDPSFNQLHVTPDNQTRSTCSRTPQNQEDLLSWCPAEISLWSNRLHKRLVLGPSLYWKTLCRKKHERVQRDSKKPDVNLWCPGSTVSFPVR